MTEQEKQYLNLCISMLDYIEENQPEVPFQIDACSNIMDFDKFLAAHRGQIENDKIFSKGWNAAAYRIKIIHDKIKTNETQ